MRDNIRQRRQRPLTTPFPGLILEMAGSESQSTPDRILETSLRMFNERGLANVSSLKIAIQLGMSQSNLAYHFKSKNDIILAVFVRMEDEVRKVLSDVNQPGQPFLPINAALRQAELMRAMWRYRFFFNALVHLLTADLVLRVRYMRMQDSIIDGIANLFDELISQGFMYKVQKPSTPRMVAKTCWMTWLSWLRFEQIEYPDRETVRDEAVYDGVIQVFTIVQHYFSQEFERKMRKELKRGLLEKDGAITTRRNSQSVAAATKQVVGTRGLKGG